MNYWPAAEPTSFSRILNKAESGSSSDSQLPRGSQISTAKWHRLIVLLLVCFASACSPNQGAADQGLDKTESAAQTSSSPAAPASPVTQKIDSNLAQLLDPLLDNTEFTTARWGVSVISLSDGKIIYERNGDKLFTPASNMKIYTTAVALDLLGSDYRWRTSVYSGADPDAAGTIQGDLILYGRGAPDLLSVNGKDNSNTLEALALALEQRGVKRVHGNVIGDESYFRGEEIGEGWQWNDLQWYFGAEVSALSVNGNEVEISIRPPRGSEEKPTITSNDVDGYVHPNNDVAMVKRGERFTIGVKRGLSDNDVRVWGEFPLGSEGYGVRLAVHRPALWAARLFVRALKERGINVDGEASWRDWRMPQTARFNPDSSHELASVISKPLSQIIEVTNKESVNLNAELILRTLGRERGAMLSQPEPKERERGDDEAGAAVVRLWLSRAGVVTDRLAIQDGSGLSRLDLVTPRASAQLLLAISRTASSGAFRESLPIAGTDGTLQGRLKSLAGKVLAKTGSLTYDNSLSGYVTTSKGEILSFSIMCNDFVDHGGSVKLIDQVVSILAGDPENAGKL